MVTSNFIDARTDAAGPDIEASVCIVGSGPAGLTLARLLAPSLSGVVLIESGSFDMEGETQDLFTGRNLALPYYNLEACRARYFGGTSNQWYGHSRPNDRIDYDGRPQLGLPKWPIGHSELAPYLEKAAQSLDNLTSFYEPRILLEHAGLAAEGLVEEQSAILSTKIFQRTAKLRLGAEYQRELEALPGLRIYLNLNLTHIQLAESGTRVTHLDCATLTGKKIRVTARLFAICCNGIENARLLLASNDVMRAGIGNESDHVGRYFMDHIYVRASKFIPAAAFPSYYDRSVAQESALLAQVGFSDDFLRRENLLQYYCEFRPVYVNGPVHEAVAAVRQNAMKPGDLKFIRDVGTMLTDFESAFRYTFRSRANLPDYFVMEQRIEQSPNPDSRVVLSNDRDALGGRVADLNWVLSEADFRTFRVAQHALVSELSALGYGRVEMEELTPESITERVNGHYHQIGTTRMSDDPAEGVVDKDCRVHGVANLYVGGSSVFPTAGYGNPTLTIIAFAWRLAETLKQAVVAPATAGRA